MIMPDKIIKTHSKRLSLTINEKGEFIVRAPIGLREEEIFKFIKEKEDWVSKKQGNVKKILSANSRLINYEDALYLGKRYEVVEVKGLDSALVDDNKLYIPYSKNKKIRNIFNFLVNKSEQLIITRVEYFSKLMKLKYNNFKLINSVAKWGMCDSKRCIYINWKLIMLPTDIIDYVVVHELSHLLQMNHSKIFWDIVASIMPDYKRRKDILKESNFLIKMF